MPPQYSPTSEQPASFVAEGDLPQHHSVFGSTHLDQHGSGYWVPQAHAVPPRIEPYAQAGTDIFEGTQPPLQHNSTMMSPRGLWTPRRMESRAKTDTNPNKSSMSYEEATELLNGYCSEALQAIEVAHIKSTQPAVLALRDENIYLKHLLQLYANAFPSFLDPNMFRNLYAEQPAPWPHPAPRPPVYASPHASISPTVSNASSPAISVSNSPSPPVMSYNSLDGMPPPKMPYYVVPGHSEELMHAAAHSPSKDGKTLPLTNNATIADYSAPYDIGFHGTYITNEGPSRFG